MGTTYQLDKLRLHVLKLPHIQRFVPCESISVGFLQQVVSGVTYQERMSWFEGYLRKVLCVLLCSFLYPQAALLCLKCGCARISGLGSHRMNIKWDQIELNGDGRLQIFWARTSKTIEPSIICLETELCYILI